jgi:hypothetical protein
MTPLPPDPNVLQPWPHAPGLVLLKPLLARSPEVANVTAGPFSDHHDFDDGLGFLSRNVLYNQGISGARLCIGADCAIAHGAHFVMPDGNHAMAGPPPSRSPSSAARSRLPCRSTTIHGRPGATPWSATMSGSAWARWRCRA